MADRESLLRLQLDLAVVADVLRQASIERPARQVLQRQKEVSPNLACRSKMASGKGAWRKRSMEGRGPCD
jgi:hypothetical protein